jgi:hypothetical protein
LHFLATGSVQITLSKCKNDDFRPLVFLHQQLESLSASWVSVKNPRHFAALEKQDEKPSPRSCSAESFWEGSVVANCGVSFASS